MQGNEKGDKRKEKGDRRRQKETKGDKADTVTSKKGTKPETDGRQAGRKANTLSRSQTDTFRKCSESLTVTGGGKGWKPAVQAPNLGDKSKEIS